MTYTDWANLIPSELLSFYTKPEQNDLQEHELSDWIKNENVHG